MPKRKITINCFLDIRKAECEACEQQTGYNGLQGLDVSDLPYDIALMVLIIKLKHGPRTQLIRQLETRESVDINTEKDSISRWACV